MTGGDRMNQYKLLSASLIVVIAALALACGDDDDDDGAVDPTDEATASASEESAFPLTLNDDLGTEVTLDAPPEAIVALAPSFVEVLYAIGAEETIVAADENTDYPPDAESIPKISGLEPSVEAIASYEPDLVLYFYDPGGFQQALDNVSITSFYLATPTTVDGVYDQIATIGELTGHSEEATTVVEDMEAEIEATLSGVDTSAGPSVFHELDPQLFTVGPGSFHDDVYQLLGASNIAESTGEPYPQMTQEAVIAENPEVIILADTDFGESADTVAARPGWDQISAVQNDRVYEYTSALLSHASPRLVDDIIELTTVLYPEES
jgi:cobalamin transport system substrate-binding protein